MNADHFARLPEYRPNSRFIDCAHLKRFQVLSALTRANFFPCLSKSKRAHKCVIVQPPLRPLHAVSAIRDTL